MDESLISKWDFGSLTLEAESATPLTASATFQEHEEIVGDFVLTYDLPPEESMDDDGGCAAFLADAKRKPRRN